MKIRYPRPLQRGETIGITAPSSGVTPAQAPRLDLVLAHLRSQGFQVEEGSCLRKKHKHVSGPKEERAADFLRLWNNPKVRAIMPPWGGEILVEILPLLDFAQLGRGDPKWISGYSDVSTLLFPLTLRTGIATVHGSNLMDLAPTQTDPLTNGMIKALQQGPGSEFTQESSELHQVKWKNFEMHVDAPLNLEVRTEWKSLRGKENENFSGRVIGGCLDTIARLAGTPFGDLPAFVREHRAEGVIFYFENCELQPCEVARTLWNLRLAGWFEGLSGVLIGRSAGPDATEEANMSYVEALHSVLDELGLPVLFDLCIGHRPPQLSIVNGSLATVSYSKGRGSFRQKLV